MPCVDVISENDERLVHLSNSARRLLKRPRPRYRGFVHRWAAVAAVPLTVLTVAVADGATERFAMALFGFGAICMLGASALVHSRDWGINQVESLIRLDHSAIFVMIAASGTPVGMLGLEGRPSVWFIVVLWVGAVLGVAFEWVPVHPPAGFVNALYLTYSWGMIAFLPWLVRDLTVVQLGFLLGGGAAYTIGAVVVGARRPDPWPATFGYHEIWHVFVVGATAVHWFLAANLAGLVG